MPRSSQSDIRPCQLVQSRVSKVGRVPQSITNYSFASLGGSVSIRRYCCCCFIYLGSQHHVLYHPIYYTFTLPLYLSCLLIRLYTRLGPHRPTQLYVLGCTTNSVQTGGGCAHSACATDRTKFILPNDSDVSS